MGSESGLFRLNATGTIISSQSVKVQVIKGLMDAEDLALKSAILHRLSNKIGSVCVLAHALHI